MINEFTIPFRLWEHTLYIKFVSSWILLWNYATVVSFEFITKPTMHIQDMIDYVLLQYKANCEYLWETHIYNSRLDFNSF